jgi:hypothetical protein
MTDDSVARDDFEHAVLKAFWRQVLSWLKGTQNRLLPYDEVRKSLPIKGQYYLGFKEVQIDQIIGSQGRYRDFDRAFLPIQTRTKGRWMSIDKAHLKQVILPPVELYKMGEVYFVKDGNHRVSVARERGQQYIDAFVTEIVSPIHITSDMSVDDLELKQEYANFVERTNLDELRPGSNLEFSIPGQSQILLDHISFHKWVLGEKIDSDLPDEQAITSWYDNVYKPITNAIQEQNILKEFPGATETDLYIWIIKYQWYLARAYREDREDLQSDVDLEITAHKEAVDKLKKELPEAPIKKLYGVLKGEDWIVDLLMQQEYAEFAERTRLFDLRPEALISPSVPGQFEILFDHIAVHRWYLGESRQSAVSYQEAALSWFDHIYLPLVEIIREKKILDKFPKRTETDFYLWVISHQAYLKELFGSDVSMEKAVEYFINNQAE